VLASESVYDVTFTWTDGEILYWKITATSSTRALLLAVADLIDTGHEMTDVAISVKRG
jgi:hypothetical protein